MSDYIKYQTDEDDGCSIESEPLIPEGLYRATYLEHWTTGSESRGKLVIHFTIADGDCQGVVLKAYFNVILKTSPKKYGKFTAKRQGDYFDQMCDLFPDLIDGRCDRISPQRLRGRTVLIEVGTVKTKWGGTKRKPHTWYSKARRITSLI